MDNKKRRGRGRPKHNSEKIAIKTTITLTVGQDDDLIAHFTGQSGPYSHIIKQLMRSGLDPNRSDFDSNCDSKADLAASLDDFIF